MSAFLPETHPSAPADRASWLADTLGDLERDGFQPSYRETRNGFDRYELAPGVELWACPECGGIHCSPLTGCERCGWRTAEWYELYEEEIAA